jgi:magnesium-transporting ATPase (P-type)
MDGPPAQSLGVEPVDHDIMRQPPRRSEEPIITSALMWRVLTAAFVICTGTLAVFFSEYDTGADEAAIRHDTTMTFTTFVMFAMFFATACRSVTKSVFSMGFMGNPMFVLAVGASIGCQVAAVYLPLLQSVFHTVPLSLMDWARVLSVSSTVLIVDEIRKVFIRMSASPSASSTSSRLRARSASSAEKPPEGAAKLVGSTGGSASTGIYQRSGNSILGGFRSFVSRGNAPGEVVRKGGNL